MNRSILRVICALIPAFVVTGCGHKTDAKSELERAAVVLGKPEMVPAQAAPEPSPQSEPAVPTLGGSVSIAASGSAPLPSPAQQMQTAMASCKAGELEDAVTRLQRLRASPALTAEQRMALQDGVAAVMTEIYGLAAKGDPKAIAAVKQYELMQTSRQ